MIGQSPVFSVSDFVGVFNQSLSVIYPDVKIFGEISNLRISRGKWVYFDLKDEYSSLKMFGAVTSLPGPLEDGMTVEVSGKPYLHHLYNFSVQFYDVSVTGQGNLVKAYQILMKKLESEGLFESSRKRSLPTFPAKVCLIASKESAGYGDFKKIAYKRWSQTEIVEFDVMVQGAQAPAQIVEAINKANQTDAETLVILRGGGSRDDLVAFDDERVVRAIASSRLPSLVAVGHERDVVLAELVADVRASTPSNAAEILLPDMKQEISWLSFSKKQFSGLVSNFVSNIESQIKLYKSSINDLLTQKIDDEQYEVDHFYKLLKAYDPRTPLAKGYVLALGPEGLIKSSVQARQIKNFDIKFADGDINVQIKE